jgi:hypothetical protein
VCISAYDRVTAGVLTTPIPSAITFAFLGNFGMMKINIILLGAKVFVMNSKRSSGNAVSEIKNFAPQQAGTHTE